MAGGALSFREDPFRLTPDRRYIFETDGFRRAFAMLLAGIRARRGAMLLTGPSGTGKTTLLQGLMAKLQQDGVIVFWRFHPDIPGYDLIGSCLVELDVKDAPADPASRAQALSKALKARTPSSPAVLIIDEAGQFADAQLAEIAALPTATGGAVQVILAGLPAVTDRLNGDELSAVNRTIALRAEIGPLDRGELGAYIAHRCRVAGQAGPLVFEPEAIGRVFDHTAGTPRLVNRLCATSLFFAEPGARQISAAVVDEAARACEGDPSAGAPNLPDSDTISHPDAAEPTPERPATRAEASEVHRTLAEAERAWIAGAAAQAVIGATAVVPSIGSTVEVEPATIDGPRAASPQEPDVLLLEEEAEHEIAPPRRRSPAFRIAAAIAIIAGSAAVLAALLWPTSVGHDYLADSAPVKAVARLLAPGEAKAPPAAAPVVAEAAVPPEPVPAAATAKPEPAVVVKAESVVAKPEPVAAKPEPTVAKPEPVVATPEPVATKPEPVVAEPAPVVAKSERIAAQPEPVVVKQPRTASKPEPVNPDPVVAKAAPTPEPPPAKFEPVVESPTPVAATAVARPGQAAPVDELVARAPEPAATEAIATTLSTIEPANGPASMRTEEPAAAPPAPEVTSGPPMVAAAIVPSSEPPAAPPAPKAEPPAVVAAIVPSSAPPPAPSAAKAEPPVARAPEPAAIATVVPPPAPKRAAQASAPDVDPAELQQLMARGDEMMRLGDPASARLFYERAAGRGLPRAYTAVGRTYDPLALQRLNVRGGGANGEQALAWYRRGSDAGDRDAERATSELSAWLVRPR